MLSFDSLARLLSSLPLRSVAGSEQTKIHSFLPPFQVRVASSSFVCCPNKVQTNVCALRSARKLKELSKMMRMRSKGSIIDSFGSVCGPDKDALNWTTRSHLSLPTLSAELAGSRSLGGAVFNRSHPIESDQQVRKQFATFRRTLADKPLPHTNKHTNERSLPAQNRFVSPFVSLWFPVCSDLCL